MIGAGAGLSTSAGFTYSGERFRRYFADFEDKYGFHDMYSGGFCCYDTPEEHWAYWSRFITVKYPFWQMTAENPKSMRNKHNISYPVAGNLLSLEGKNK